MEKLTANEGAMLNAFVMFLDKAHKSMKASVDELIKVRQAEIKAAKKQSIENKPDAAAGPSGV